MVSNYVGAFSGECALIESIDVTVSFRCLSFMFIVIECGQSPKKGLSCSKC